MSFCNYVTYHSTEKFYVGKACTNDVLNHKYIGSGIRLFKALKKYPKRQWMTDIIAEFATEAEAYANEARLIDQDLLDDPLCLNLKLGGLGAAKGTPSPRKGKKCGPLTTEHRAKISSSLAGNTPTRGTTGKTYTVESRQKQSTGIRAYWARVRAGELPAPAGRGPNKAKE